MKYKIHVLIFLISFLILTRFNIDPDLGWHLAIGNEFLETGRVIRGDEFSWTMPHFLWGNTYFLYEVFVSVLFANLNFALIVTIFGLISAAGILFLLSKKVNLITLLVVGLGVAIATSNLGIRPHTFSFLFFSVLIFALDRRYFQKPTHIIFWFILFLLWGNIHRGYLVGLVVFAAFVLADYFTNYFKGIRHDLRFPTLTFGAALFATIVNPFGLRAWQSGIIGDATSFENIMNITEWKPIVLVFPVNIIFALSGAIYIYILKAKGLKIDFAWIFLSSLIFAFTFISVAFTFFWAAIFIFLATRHAGLGLKLNIKKIEQIPLYFSTTAVILALVLNFFIEVLQFGNIENRMIYDKYPLKATRFIKERGVLENVFNEYGWGGFIDWQLPQQKVFIDGRMASWKFEGKSILSDYMAIREGDCVLVSQYQIKSVIFPAGKDIECFGNWEVIYEDEIAKVLVSGN